MAVRNDRHPTIHAADFDDARDRLIIGRREGSNVLLPEEKHAVAVHESGHALVAALSPKADPVAKVTILPAGQALGVTEQLPLVERHLYGEDYLYDSLAVRLGGRAAELVELGQGSTGAASDLASVPTTAIKMVQEFRPVQGAGSHRLPRRRVGVPRRRRRLQQPALRRGDPGPHRHRGGGHPAPGRDAGGGAAHLASRPAPPVGRPPLARRDGRRLRRLPDRRGGGALRHRLRDDGGPGRRLHTGAGLGPGGERRQRRERRR